MQTLTKKVAQGAASLLTLTLLSGCPAPEEKPTPSPEEEPVVTASVKGQLKWKRQDALAADLSRALALGEDELCKEVGRYDCIDYVHKVALGGNEPEEAGQYMPLAEPGASTPIAVERVVFAACSAAAYADREVRAAPVAFWGIDLNAAALDASDERTREGASKNITALYQSLLARDPLKREVDAVLTLMEDDAGQGVSGDTFAVLACFTIATQSEFLFY